MKHAQETAFAPEAPQPLLREIAPGAAYPVAALGPLASAVQAVRCRRCGAGGAVQAVRCRRGFADVETLGGNRPLALYVLTIAGSGERKSACDAPLMAGLRASEMDQAKAQRDAVASWQNAHALWKGERDRILQEARKGKGEKRTAAQADLAALGAEPAAPPSADRRVTEPTFEGLTRLFATGPKPCANGF